MNVKDIMYRLNILDIENNQTAIYEEAKDDEKHLHIELLKSVDEFIKKNPSTKEVTSPIFFRQVGKSPNPEGLLSYEIFGLTKEERSGIFGYIDLHTYFIHPLIYKKLARMDRKFRDIIHGTETFSISSSGELKVDPNGKTGIKWLKANFNKIKIRETSSDKRSDLIKFIKNNQDRMWMNKLLVLPAYYRDVNTEADGKVSVGEINNLYASLLISVKGIKETEDYGLSVADSINGRIQETILAIYDWFSGNNNDALDGATGLSKKNGIIRRAGISKTTDYGSRLVLSAPNLKVETIDDMMVNTKQCAVPLASVCANFEPFMLYHIRHILENTFVIGNTIEVYNSKTKKFETKEIEEETLKVSDDEIKEELKRFIHGYSNRLIPISIKLKDGKEVFLKFKGRHHEEDFDPENPEAGSSSLINRRVTWCDIFYRAAVEVTKDKCVLVTRYPIDSMYNQFPCRIVVSSTIEMEPIYYEHEFYRYYPKIREEDIGSDTSNMFIDTLRISNVFLKRIVGDYDGDQVSCKGVFTNESNDELNKFIDSKANYIGLDGKCSLITTNESIQAIYNLTRVLPGTKLDEVKF